MRKMKKTLNITVAGGVVSGKTTIATLIAKYLESIGVKVELHDDDNEPVLSNVMVMACLRSLVSQDINVVITTVQANRNKI